jgi:hypothetical protein
MSFNLVYPPSPSFSRVTDIHDHSRPRRVPSEYEGDWHIKSERYAEIARQFAAEKGDSVTETDLQAIRMLPVTLSNLQNEIYVECARKASRVKQPLPSLFSAPAVYELAIPFVGYSSEMIAVWLQIFEYDMLDMLYDERLACEYPFRLLSNEDMEKERQRMKMAIMHRAHKWGDLTREPDPFAYRSFVSNTIEQRYAPVPFSTAM